MQKRIEGGWGGGEMREDVGEEECDGRRMIASLTWAK
jgi:hypothetical protein